MTNREKILSQPFKDVILENTKCSVDDLKNVTPMCEYFYCFYCRFRDEKDCETKMEEWLNEEATE